MVRNMAIIIHIRMHEKDSFLSFSNRSRNR
jgi:hypothetical protein